MRESEYIRTVHKLLPASVYHLKLNLPYTAGVPDCYYSGSRADLWIEWKYLKRIPPRVDLVSGRFPLITKLQKDWLEQRHREGRNVAVVVGCANGCVVYPELSWREVVLRADFIERLRPRAIIASWITDFCTGPYAPTEIAPRADSIAIA